MYRSISQTVCHCLTDKCILVCVICNYGVGSDQLRRIELDDTKWASIMAYENTKITYWRWSIIRRGLPRYTWWFVWDTSVVIHLYISYYAHCVLGIYAIFGFVWGYDWYLTLMATLTKWSLNLVVDEYWCFEGQQSIMIPYQCIMVQGILKTIYYKTSIEFANCRNSTICTVCRRGHVMYRVDNKYGIFSDNAFTYTHT